MTTYALIAKDIINNFFQVIQDQTAEWTVGIAKMIMEMIWVAIKPHWPTIAFILLFLLIWLTIKAFAGYWAPLGSLLFHLIYFGFWGGIIAFMGWGILFNPLFDLIAFIFYFIAYWSVGLFLKSFIRR